MNNLVIGFHGTRQVGKDTLFNVLNKIDGMFTRYSYADALKSDLSELVSNCFGWNIYKLNPKQKEIIRPIMITYGCAQREVDINHWVKIVAEDIKQDLMSGFNGIPVITDNRFVNEVEYMRKFYGKKFVLVDVTRDGAPEPTYEEKKHFEKVAALADIKFNWGNDTEESMLYKGKILYEKLKSF